jgi:hypothetical protein
VNDLYAKEVDADLCDSLGFYWGDIQDRRRRGPLMTAVRIWGESLEHVKARKGFHNYSAPESHTPNIFGETPEMVYRKKFPTVFIHTKRNLVMPTEEFQASVEPHFSFGFDIWTEEEDEDMVIDLAHVGLKGSIVGALKFETMEYLISNLLSGYYILSRPDLPERVRLAQLYVNGQLLTPARVMSRCTPSVVQELFGIHEEDLENTVPSGFRMRKLLPWGDTIAHMRSRKRLNVDEDVNYGLNYSGSSVNDVRGRPIKGMYFFYARMIILTKRFAESLPIVARGRLRGCTLNLRDLVLGRLYASVPLVFSDETPIFAVMSVQKFSEWLNATDLVGVAHGVESQSLDE